MGLDQYLYRKLYVSKYDFGSPKAADLTLSGPGFETVTPPKVRYIVELAGQWRKANQIHQWFVDNVQDGNDDCGTYYVGEEQLRELLDTIDTVLRASKLQPAVIKVGTHAGKDTDYKWEPVLEDGQMIVDPSTADELLPTASGFFFGSTEYNNYYIEDLEYTKKVLLECLDPKYETWEFEYSSSW